MPRRLTRSNGHTIAGGSQRPPGPRHHHGTTLLWTLSVGVLLLDALLLIGVLADGNSAGNSVGAGLAAVAFLLVVALALGWAARRRTRRARAVEAGSDAPRASGLVGGGGTPPTWGAASVARAPDRRGIGWRRRAGDPRVVVALVFVLFLASGGAAIADFRDAERSDYTQHHGIRDGAVIVRDDNNVDCGKSGCSHTFSAPIHLIAPVDGQFSSTVHGQGELTGGDGSVGTVLVDPHQPSYAEFPGNKLHASGSWIGYAIGAVFFLGVLLLLVYLVLLARIRGQRMGARAAASAQPPGPDAQAS